MTHKDELLDLAGKVVWLELEGSAEPSGILLEYAEFRSIAGRNFLVGRMATWDVSGWVAGVEAGAAWDKVVSYMVYKSREDYQERAATHKPGFRERLRGR